MGTLEEGVVSPHGQTAVPVGISSCLLGDNVRYNGQHRKAHLLLAELSQYVRWVPICPEVEVGMGVPREPVHLVEGGSRAGGESNIGPCRLVGIESGRDWTRDMREFAASCTRDLEQLGVSGYIFKERSPSCGVREVPVHTVEKVPSRQGPGLFAAAVRARFPGLPVAEETELQDAAACREFLERVREYQQRCR